MRHLLPFLSIMLAGCTALPAASKAQAAPSEQCQLSPSDRAWLDQAMAAWDLTSREITKVGRLENIRAVFFDAQCLAVSSTAMKGGPNEWAMTLHEGKVQVPDGPTLPVGVISFAMGQGESSQFVMSTPSVWRAAVKSDNDLGSLETLMTVVVIHEANHVSQVPTYIPAIERITKANKLPDDFNDDSIQERFQSEPQFAASIARETELLFAAANAADETKAKRLAREARGLIQARHARWFTGADAYLREADDIWLTMEGSAQWAAYQWVIHPQGGKLAEQTAYSSFSKGRWWSQVQGFALFLVLDRLAGDRWKQHAFGDGSKTALEMLDEALAS